ncbi:phosphatase PAP2 family protein [uncultured Bacteroides sp.]|uniref:phosphatase PAP2 family protein n=1 Tax=uncultured Bacteroides sp. TaxID=162156 RepID=UPI002AAC2D9D|nr:phosphatase PAP2 family protein [uncultured Bacteroides sp.]
MKRFRVIVLLLALLQLQLSAQEKTDSIKRAPLINKTVVKRSILPLSLITVGTLISGSHLEKQIKKELRDGDGVIDYSIPVDDLIQYIPIAEIYIADALGVKSKNHWFDQTKYMLISNAITAALTHGTKFLINKRRPNGSPYSFPSGHSSFSFTNATVLYEEFHDSSPVFAYSGYFLTSLVGSLRVINNKHWLSDVLAGAGLGILVTRMVYYFEPLKNWNPCKKMKNISLIPEIDSSGGGLTMVYRF